MFVVPLPLLIGLRTWQDHFAVPPHLPGWHQLEVSQLKKNKNKLLFLTRKFIAFLKMQRLVEHHHLDFGAGAQYPQRAQCHLDAAAGRASLWPRKVGT